MRIAENVPNICDVKLPEKEFNSIEFKKKILSRVLSVVLTLLVAKM